MNLVNEDVFSVPSGYVISDMELGWDGGEHLTRLLWLKDGDAKIWKVNSGIVNEFDFSLDGWRAAEIETTYDDKIRLMFVNEGLAQVWRINQFSGLKENFKEYSLE